MKVIREARAFSGRASVAALGMFDGVHIGHQKLIRTAVALARQIGADCVVCTFDRHPLSVVLPERAPKPLLTLDENLARFEALGADWALVQSFTPEYGATPPEAFLRQLTEQLRVKGIVVGENYTFGRGGAGTPGLIQDLAPSLGYRAVIVPPVLDGDVMCSSTLIRRLLAEGETEHANRLLALREG